MEEEASAESARRSRQGKHTAANPAVHDGEGGKGHAVALLTAGGVFGDASTCVVNLAQRVKKNKRRGIGITGRKQHESYSQYCESRNKRARASLTPLWSWHPNVKMGR